MCGTFRPLLLTIAVAVAFSCSSEGSPPQTGDLGNSMRATPCTAGMTVACPCLGGAQGIQSCDPGSGAFSECVCDSGDSGLDVPMESQVDVATLDRMDSGFLGGAVDAVDVEMVDASASDVYLADGFEVSRDIVVDVHDCEGLLLTDPSNCGRCGNACEVPAHGTASCVAGVCGVVCNVGYLLVGSACSPAPPRPISPLSTRTVTNQRPTLSWVLASGTDGARVQICRDRACSDVEQSFTVSGSSGRVPMSLTPGVHFWRLHGRVGSEVGVTAGATWQFVVGHRSAPVDSSWGSTPDVNGDGYSDVVVGAPATASLLEPDVGAVYVFAGSASGISSVPVARIVGPDAARNFGQSVFSAVDVNGDGYGDVIVGGTRRSYLYLGGPSGLSAVPSVTLPGPDCGGCRHSVAGLGDVNGDGYADVGVIGMPRDNVQVFFGSSGGISLMSSAALTAPSEAQFGEAVAGAGDINADGRDDVLVSGTATGTSGTVWVYLGSVGGVSRSHAMVLTGPTVSGWSGFGTSMGSAGDVNGDGYLDVVIGAGVNSSASAFVFYGDGGGLSSEFAVLSGTAMSGFGAAVGMARDLNADGFCDIYVGSPRVQSGSVFYGSSAGVSSLAVFGLTPPEGSSRFGFAGGSPGDTNGDGIDDLIVGAPHSAPSAVSQLLWYPGSREGLRGIPSRISADPGPSSFGFSMAF